jgi:hypothetical protein
MLATAGNYSRTGHRDRGIFRNLRFEVVHMSLGMHYIGA